MTQALSHDGQRFTVKEYITIDSDSPIRHEYVNGRIIDMAGGTDEHSKITCNVIGELRSRLRGTLARSEMGTFVSASENR